MLKAIAGHDPKDPLSCREPAANYPSAIGKPVKGLRVGLIAGYFDEFMSAEVKAAFDAAVEQLKTLGMKVVKLEIPYTDLIAAVQLATSRVENVATAHEYLKNSPPDYSPALFYRHIKSLLIPADVYVTAQRVRRLICEAFDAAFDKVDVIAAPTVGSPAQTIEECQQGFAMVDGKRVPLQEERGTTGTLCTIPDVIAAVREMRRVIKRFRSAPVCRARTFAGREGETLAGSAHAGVEASRRRLSSEPPDPRASRGLRFSHRANRDGIHERTQADDLHVRRQSAANVAGERAGPCAAGSRPAPSARGDSSISCAVN